MIMSPVGHLKAVIVSSQRKGTPSSETESLLEINRVTFESI